MPSYYEPEHCAICGRAIWYMSPDATTTEHGAVHEDCIGGAQ